MRKARVFISCGQRTDKEISIGLAVRDYFHNERGFETYFAQRVHDPDALTENIFRHLKNSEYYVFIDFNREEIGKSEYRGSLFVGQELAIATFLGIQGIGFYEKGRRREGIESFHIYNAFEFEDGTQILQKIKENTSHWDCSSVNEIAILYDPNTTSKEITILDDANRPLSDWYHLEITNRNKRKHAIRCFGYIINILDINNNVEIPIATNELIWAGIGDISVNIMAGGKRELDAFFVMYRDDFIRFNQRRLTTTNPRYYLPNLPRGRYLITYTIISMDFETSTKTFLLIHEGSCEQITFEEYSG